jgi:RNA polymerase sigma factor (sigma-70 family)
MAYDMYAAALYGYCHWIVHDSAEAAESLQDTFVVAAAKMSDLPDPSKLRPWLFALARNECRRRVRPQSTTLDNEADAANQQADAGQRAEEVGRPTDAAELRADVTMPLRAFREQIHEPTDATVPFPIVGQLADVTVPFRVISEPADTTDSLADIDGYLGQAELRTLIRSILADLKSREREVIELSFRHDLYEDDLAIVLGVSQSRAHALASRARGQLEKSFSALRTALAGREACPVVGELLADWDGQLTEQTRDLVMWHIEQCQTCASRGRRALRPTALSGLLPLAPLPSELRKQVLSCCSSTDEDAVAYRRRVVRRAEALWFSRFSQAIRWMSWDSIRANPGAAIAITAVAVWIVAAVCVMLLTFASSPTAHARVHGTTPGTSSNRSSVPPSPANGRASTGARPSPAASQAATGRSSSVQSSATSSSQPSSSQPSGSSPSQPSSSPSQPSSSSSQPSSSPSQPSASPSSQPSGSPSSQPSGSPSSQPSGSSSPSSQPSGSSQPSSPSQPSGSSSPSQTSSSSPSQPSSSS